MANIKIKKKKLSKKEKKVLGKALRLLFDETDDYKINVRISDLAEKFKTNNAEEIKNDLLFITYNIF
jgi:hypothetical protein